MTEPVEKCGTCKGGRLIWRKFDELEGAVASCPDCTAPAKKCRWPAHGDCECVGCLDGLPLGSGRYHFKGENMVNCTAFDAPSPPRAEVSEGECSVLSIQERAWLTWAEKDLGDDARSMLYGAVNTIAELREKLAEYERGVESWRAEEQSWNEEMATLRAALAEAERQRDEAEKRAEQAFATARMHADNALARVSERDAAQKAMEEYRELKRTKCEVHHGARVECGQCADNARAHLSAAREEAKGVRERLRRLVQDVEALQIGFKFHSPQSLDRARVWLEAQGVVCTCGGISARMGSCPLHCARALLQQNKKT